MEISRGPPLRSQNQFNMNPPRKKFLGFTLIELLVVIAIIAILAGLLIPGINGTIERSKVARASSDLRQIGAAMILFAGENQGFFPVSGSEIPYGQIDPRTGKPSWQEQLDPYIEDNRRIFGGPNLKPLGDGNYQAAYFNGSHAAYEEALSAGATERFLPVQQIRIQFPSKYILAGEIGNSKFRKDDADCDNFTQEPAFNGGQRENPLCLLFADGHVGTFKTFDEDRMMITYSE